MHESDAEIYAGNSWTGDSAEDRTDINGAPCGRSGIPDRKGCRYNPKDDLEANKARAPEGV